MDVFVFTRAKGASRRGALALMRKVKQLVANSQKKRFEIPIPGILYYLYGLKIESTVLDNPDLEVRW